MDSKDYTGRKYSLSAEGATPSKKGRFFGADLMYQPKDIAPAQMSLSDEDETFEEHGNFNTYAKDIILQSDTAPASAKQNIAESVKENTIKFSEPTKSKPVSYKIPFLSLAVILIVILALVTFLSIEHRNEILLSEAAYADIEKKYDVLNNKYINLLKRNNELQINYNKIIDEYEFYKYCAVCVNENDPYYHHFTCKHFDTSRFWIYNIEAAQGKGYEPCPDCRLTE